MGTRENKVESYLKAQVEQLNGLCYKWTSPEHAGVPDRIVIYCGKVFFVEIKTADGKLSIRQKREISRLINEGALVFIACGKKGVDFFINSVMKPWSATTHARNMRK